MSRQIQTGNRLSIYLIVTLACLLISTSAMALPRLDKNVIPTFQLINLTLNPDSANYSGSTTIELDVINPTASFRFHSEALNLLSLTLKDANNEYPVTYEIIEPDQLTLTAEKSLEPGKYTLHIEFTNEYNTQGVSLYRTESGDESYLFTQMEDMEAREAFPCWDEPEYKFPFQMILTVPKDDYPIVNTPIESQKELDNGWIEYTFETTKPLPTYLLAICLGPFDLVDLPYETVPIRIVTAKGKGHLTELCAELTPPILKWQEEYFNLPYPYKKLDLIAVPEFWPGGMENAGAITFTERAIVIDPANVTMSSRRRLANLMAHELAHMWFGDLVTMEWWDDLWLNEAFATWMATKTLVNVFPEFDYDISRVNSTDRVMSSDARPTAEAIRKPIDENSDLLGNIGAVYNKGEAILNMFEISIDENNFRNGVIDYINANSWGSATAADLWKALSENSNAAYSLPEAMATFTDQPGVPLVTCTKNEDGSYQLSQTRFKNYGQADLPFENWHIPINIKYKTEQGIQNHSLLLMESSVSVELPADGKIEWVLPNLDFKGYYRWNVSTEMMFDLAENSSAYLTPRERIGYLNNLSALLKAGVIGGDDFLDAIGRFKDDDHPQVISSVMNALGSVEGYFVVDSLQDSFAAYVRHTLKPAMDKIGLTATENEDNYYSVVRPSLLGWLAYTGKDSVSIRFAHNLFEKYLNDPQSVDPSLVSISNQIACRHGKKELFGHCMKKFEEAKTPRDRGLYLSALGAFENKELQKEALAYVFNGSLKLQEIGTIPRGIASTSEEAADMVFDWVMANFEELKSNIPPIYHPYLVYYGGGCSQTRLTKAQQFFSLSENTSEGIAGQLEKLGVSVNDCISLREREGDKVAQYLINFSSK